MQTQLFFKSTLPLLRIPFSLHLLPTFLFAWSFHPASSWQQVLGSLVILHFLVYPASNGFNSYADQDKGPIGGLARPPKPSLQLYYVTLCMDILALVGALFIQTSFAAMLLVYILVSRAYSHPAIRLKKYPVISFLVVFVFQGAWVYAMVLSALNVNFPLNFVDIGNMVIASCLVGAGYPLSQVYQHRADQQKGDLTLSRLLGVEGTFRFSKLCSLFGIIGLIASLYSQKQWLALAFLVPCMFPALLFFNRWYQKIKRSYLWADFEHTMCQQQLASKGLNLFFISFLFVRFSQLFNLWL